MKTLMELAPCANEEGCGLSAPTTMMDATGEWFVVVCRNCGQAGLVARTEEGAIACWNAKQEDLARKRAARRGYGR